MSTAAKRRTLQVQNNSALLVMRRQSPLKLVTTFIVSLEHFEPMIQYDGIDSLDNNDAIYRSSLTTISSVTTSETRNPSFAAIVQRVRSSLRTPKQKYSK